MLAETGNSVSGRPLCPLCLRQNFVFLILICKSYPAVSMVCSHNNIPALPSNQQVLAQSMIWFTQFSDIRWLHPCVYWLSPALPAPKIRPPWDTARHVRSPIPFFCFRHCPGRDSPICFPISPTDWTLQFSNTFYRSCNSFNICLVTQESILIIPAQLGGLLIGSCRKEDR